MTPFGKPKFGSKYYAINVCEMTEDLRKEKIAEASKKYGKPWITEIIVKPMKVKSPVLGKSKFPFQR